MKKLKLKQMTIKQRNSITGYAFLLPWILGFLIFTAIPFVYSIYISFNNITFKPTGIEMSFVGLKWYKEALTVDTTFTINLLDSVQFIFLSSPMIVVSSLIMALLLNGKFHGRTFFRALYFFPVIVISGPVINELISTNASKIITPGKYAVYNFLSMLPENVFSSSLLYIFDNLVLILWFSGIQILIYLAGLQKIGTSIYEASNIDGASSWQVFWKITLPFMKPMILINAIFTISQLASFANNKINKEITSKMTLVGKVYSYSSAMSWIYFVCILAMIGFVFLLFRESKRDRI